MAITTTLPEILIVEDDPGAGALLRSALERHAVGDVHVVVDGEQALERLAERLPDLVVLDLHLPGRSGLQILESLTAMLAVGQLLPVIAVTADDRPELSRRALELGAIDLLHKPFDVEELITRVGNQLQVGATVDAMRRVTTMLERDVDDLRIELDRTLENQLHQLRTVAALRDNTSPAHMDRIGEAAAALARAADLDAETVESLRLAAPLHDIGNVALPDSILFKTGALSPDERALMQTHTLQGARVLGISPHPVLQLARTIALTHHERWDGRGYPRRLESWEIPVAGRITAVVDVFDALVHERAYKPAWSVDQAVDEMRRVRGTRLDPALVDVFLASCIDTGETDTPSADTASAGTASAGTASAGTASAEAVLAVTGTTDG